MMKYVLAFLMMSQGALADAPPPVPEGGLSFYFESDCSDRETGAEGHCYLGYDQNGQKYLTFWQKDELMFIRRVLSDEAYETIWVNAKFNSI